MLAGKAGNAARCRVAVSLVLVLPCRGGFSRDWKLYIQTASRLNPLPHNPVGWLAGWCGNCEPHAALDVACFDAATHILLYDHLRHVKSDPGAFFLGSKIRIKYLRQHIGGDSTGIILDDNFRYISVLGNIHAYPAFCNLLFLYRILGIRQQINQHLGIFVAKSIGCYF